MRIFWLALPALVLVPLASAAAQVPGSYRQSCRNVYQTGSQLSADCKGPGGFTHSTLDLNRCRGQGVFNAYGRLACGNVQGSVEDGGGPPRGGYEGGPPRGGYDGGYRPPPPGPGYGPPPGQDDDDDGYAPPPRRRLPPPNY